MGRGELNVVDHAEGLGLQDDSTGLTLCADAFGPGRMTRWALRVDAEEGFFERRDIGAAQLGLVGGGVDLSKMRVKGKVLDLFFGQIFRVEGI